MSEEKIEIEVRTLTGDAITVKVPANNTVAEFKTLLSSVFPPAASNFHLFFKGVKMGLQSRLSTHYVGPGDFIVLIPFVKKDKAPQKNLRPDCVKNVTEEKEKISAFADSAYSEMMQEMSYLFDDSRDESQTGGSFVFKPSYFVCKRKGDYSDTYSTKPEVEGGVCAFLWNVMQSPGKNILGEENCEKFVELLRSLNCLASPHSGKCVSLTSWSDGGVETCEDSRNLCLCPMWLKRTMEAFAFVNIFYGFIQMQRMETTSACLKEALKQLGKFGFKASFEDIEHLSILYPKLVLLEHKDKKVLNSDDFVVIINSETEMTDKLKSNTRTAKKAITLSKVFTAVKQRNDSFRQHLWEAISAIVRKTSAASVELFSLEDVLKFMNESGPMKSTHEAKRAKRSHSSASQSYSSRTKCHDTSQLLPVEMVQHLREGIGSAGQIVHVEDIDARKAVLMDIPHDLSDNAKSALKYMGITKLYCHQAEAIMKSLSGKNVVVATMTSSGKSLCYNVPVLEVLSQNFSACALYMFPTKALAQDQVRALLAMIKVFDTSINIGVYDGDTPQEERSWLRTNARLLITNPDMLHMSILPSHREFSRILGNLRYIVIDEAHAYKGVFGCHTALVLRRLRRLCSHLYGSNPSYVFCTATSANPREHCMELASLSTLELINNDGSPSSQKLFALWNPCSISEALHECDAEMDVGVSPNKRMSPISDVSYLFAEMVQHGLRCIAFCRSRKLTEIVLSYAREILQETAPHLVDSVCAYRAGYVAEDRRKIERDFFSGKLCGVAATNALELGIDVGHIDATLHLGFPGSIASLWQQAGRSGRRKKPSLAVYVAFEGPLDQYFMKFPKKLFNSPIECCHIDSQNQQVLEQHLVCAAFEHPLSLLYDEKYFGSLEHSLTSLKKKGYLSFDPLFDPSARIWTYIGQEKMPCRGISIRSIETVKYQVIDMQQNIVLEEIEENRAFFQVYDGAVYMHQGKTYLVKDLNLSEKIALCQVAKVPYYTKTRDYTDIHVLGGELAYTARGTRNQSAKTTARAQCCTVTTTWFGYHVIQRGINKILDSFDLSLPKYSYDSKAVWIQVPQEVKASVVAKNFSFRGGLHAASHAVLNVVPLYIRCNLSDLAPECPNPHDSRFYPERILIYDHHPGGTGISVQVQPYFSDLLNTALELLTSCRCSESTGCPNCVQSIVCHEYNEDVHKDAAILIIKGVLDREKSFFEELQKSSNNPGR